jgi:hypothetical protein
MALIREEPSFPTRRESEPGMTTLIDCPTCSRKLTVPEELLGQPVRCPGCGGTFEAGPGGVLLPAGTSAADPEEPAFVAPAPPQAVTAAAPAPGPGPSGTEVRGRACPHCGRGIDELAVHCRFCGEDLAEEIDRPWERRYRPQVRRDCEPHRGVIVLVLGILSLVVPYLGCVLGAVAWVMGQRDLKKMTERTMDPEGRGTTQAGRICGIVGTFYQGLLLLGMVAYLVVLFSVVVPGMTATKPVPVPPPKAGPVPVAPQPAPAPAPPGGGR